MERAVTVYFDKETYESFKQLNKDKGTTVKFALNDMLKREVEKLQKEGK